MQKINTLIIILLTVISSGVFSQTDSAKNRIYIIKTDLLTPVVGLFVGGKCAILTVETGIKKRHSFQLTTGFANQKMKNLQDGITSYYSYYWTFFINPEYKFFISKKRNFTGIYVGGSLTYQNVENQDIYLYNWPDMSGEITLDYTEHDVGVGAIVGYQNYYKHFVYDINLGLAYNTTFSVDVILNSSNIGNLGYNGIVYIGAVNIGYRF